MAGYSFGHEQKYLHDIEILLPFQVLELFWILLSTPPSKPMQMTAIRQQKIPDFSFHY